MMGLSFRSGKYLHSSAAVDSRTLRTVSRSASQPSRTTKISGARGRSADCPRVGENRTAKKPAKIAGQVLTNVEMAPLEVNQEKSVVPSLAARKQWIVVEFARILSLSLDVKGILPNSTTAHAAEFGTTEND
jgi:hypothetical protein